MTWHAFVPFSIVSMADQQALYCDPKCTLSLQISGGNRSGGCERTGFRKNVDEKEVLAVGADGNSGNGGEEKIATSQTKGEETKHDCRYRSEGDPTSYRRVGIVVLRFLIEQYFAILHI